MSTPLISAKNITQHFEIADQSVVPVRNVNFEIEENSFNIIYGSSGSGKSTLLNILAGLQPPTTGSIFVDGKDLYKQSRDELANFRARRLGFIYQTNYWIKSLTVIDNVAMALYFSGMNRSQAKKLSIDALAKVNMQSYANKYPTTLSGGEQQRVATARALVANPSFLIADEPTGSLDSKNGDMVMSLLNDCKVNFGQTIILVTHAMEYLPLGDRLLHIEDGKVEQMDSTTVQTTVNKLFNETRSRIKRLSEIRNGK